MEGHLWPAKVLSRSGISPKINRKKAQSLEVQILSVDEKIKVKSTDVKILGESQIESITSTLVAQSKASVPPGEEMAHRRALTVTLEILNERTNWGLVRASGAPETTTQSRKGPQNQPHKKYRESKGDLLRSLKKNENPKSLLVRPRCEDAPGSDQLRVHTAITTSLPREMQTVLTKLQHVPKLPITLGR